MRILHVGPLPPPPGGMATVVAGLRGALTGRHEVRVLDTVKTTALDRRLWQGIAAQLRLLAALAWHCLRWRPQVVHIHTCSGFSFWRNGVDVVLARLLGRCVVLHVHGGFFEDFLGGLGPAGAAAARWVFRRCARVVLLSEAWRDRLAPWLDAARVAVIGNGVAVPPRVERAARDGITVICLAAYEPTKGLADLIAAAARVPGVRLRLFGGETGAGQRAALIAAAEAAGIADRTEIPGPVLGADKDVALRDADVFCLPSHGEAMPMSMLEAMAYALPVVATRVGSIPEVIRDGDQGRLVEVGDVAALAAALRALRDDAPGRVAMGARGRAAVEAGYSVARAAAAFEALYRAACGGRG